MLPANELSDRVMLRQVLLGTAAMVAAAREMANQGRAAIKGPVMILAYATELERALMVHLAGDLPSEASVGMATFGLLGV